MPLQQPLSDEFWQREARALADIMRPWIEARAGRGIEEGLHLLDEMGFGDLTIDWNLVNDWARAWSMAHTAEVVSQITTTSMDAFTRVFPDWAASGEHLDRLKDMLSASYEPWRAKLIAATETTRAYANGNRVSWGASGLVDEVQWFTGQDELVCPVCGDLAGKTARLDGTFPGGIETPPAHPGCRCYIQPIVNTVVHQPTAVAAADQELDMAFKGNRNGKHKD